MAQTSIGFAGAVNEAAWSKLSAFLGSNPCVGTVADLALSAVGGVRRVLVAAGSAYQDGILTTLSVGESPPVDIVAPAAGQWHLVVLRRVWATKTTSLVYLAHTTTTNVLPSVVPTTYPAGLLVNPGTSSDQVLGWAWANVTNTTLALYDLRRISDAGRIVALESGGSTASRDAYWGIPADAAAERALQDRAARWFNTDSGKGYEEQYYAFYNVTTNPNGASAKGWYPVINQDTVLLANTTNSPVTVTNSGALLVVASGTFNVARACRVEMFVEVITSHTGNMAGYLQIFINNVQVGIGMRVANFGSTAPAVFSRNIKAAALPGANTYSIRMSAEAGGLTYTANNIYAEIWAD